MKPIWTNILPASVLENGAADPDFALEHTEEPDPKDADTEVATDSWNLPPVKPWEPMPERPVSMWTQIRESKLLRRLP